MQTERKHHVEDPVWYRDPRLWIVFLGLLFWVANSFLEFGTHATKLP
jgi:hypothetical protein